MLINCFSVKRGNIIIIEEKNYYYLVKKHVKMRKVTQEIGANHVPVGKTRRLIQIQPTRRKRRRRHRS